MDDMMTFPNTVEEFMEWYKITDTEHIYTNGTELVPIFRMKQWFDHKPEPKWIPCSERLPGTEEQVLIYAWNVHYVLAKYKEIRTCDGVYKMAWVTEDAYNIPQEIKHEVICWMPLPEPYAERKTDEKKNI